MLVVNGILVVFCWNMAKKDFENNKTLFGWGYIFLSALNAVAIALSIF